jgi:hypothetical protein
MIIIIINLIQYTVIKSKCLVLYSGMRKTKSFDFSLNSQQTTREYFCKRVVQTTCFICHFRDSLSNRLSQKCSEVLKLLNQIQMGFI